MPNSPMAADFMALRYFRAFDRHVKDKSFALVPRRGPAGSTRRRRHAPVATNATDPDQAALPRKWAKGLAAGDNNLADLISATQEELKKRRQRTRLGSRRRGEDR